MPKNGLGILCSCHAGTRGGHFIPKLDFLGFPVGAAAAFQASLKEEKYLYFKNELLFPVTAAVITGLTSASASAKWV